MDRVERQEQERKMAWTDPSIKVKADLKGALSQAASLMYWMTNNPKITPIMDELGLTSEFKEHYTKLVSSPVLEPPPTQEGDVALPPGEIPEEIVAT